jgi:hypothetical protein
MDIGGAKIIILAVDASTVIMMAMGVMIMAVGMSVTMIVAMAAR